MLPKRGFYKNNQQLSIAQEVSRMMAQAVRMSRVNDFKSSQEYWDSLSGAFSENLENMAAHSMSIFAYLKLFGLMEAGKIKFPSQGDIGFVPSGPSVDRRVLRQLDLGDSDLEEGPAHFLNSGQFVELDFSKKMLEAGQQALGDDERLNQIEANMIEGAWPIADKSLKFLAGSELWTLSDRMPNAQGVNPKVWYLSEANRVLAQGGVMMLLSHHLDFSDELIRNLSNFGFKVINADRELGVNQQGLKEEVGKEYIQHIKKMMRHVDGARVLYVVKEAEMPHDVEALRMMKSLDLTFKEQSALESSGRFINGFNGRIEDVDLKVFPWEVLNAGLITDQLLTTRQFPSTDNDQGALENILHAWVGTKDARGQRGLSLRDLEQFLKDNEEDSDLLHARQLVDRVVAGLENEIALSPFNKGLEGLRDWYKEVRSILNDSAMRSDLGGIDLTADDFLKNVVVGDGQEIKIDPSLLQEWESSLGVEPNIVGIQMITNVPAFLGV